MQMKLKIKTKIWTFCTYHTTPKWINVHTGEVISTLTKILFHIKGNEWVPLKYYNICSESMD